MKASSWGSIALILACLVPLPPCAVASSPATTQVVVFGDDNSDNGNCFNTIGCLHLQPPYYGGRASNGPLAVEWMLSTLDINLYDYAFIGAKTVGNVIAPQFPGMDAQVSTFLASGPPFDSSHTVFVLWGGFRDLLEAPSPTTVTSAIVALATRIQALYNAGARRFVVANMVDISLSPSIRALGSAPQAQMHALVVAFNSGLDSALASLATLQEIKLARADVFSPFSDMVADPGSYGFSNVVDSCLADGVNCVPSQYLFWDAINPTTRCHQLLGSELWRVVSTTAPDLIHSDGFE